MFQGRQLDEQPNSRTALCLAVLKLHMHAKNKYILLQCLGSNQQSRFEFFLKKKWSDILSGMLSHTMLASEIAEIIFVLFDNGKYKLMNKCTELLFSEQKFRKYKF